MLNSWWPSTIGLAAMVVIWLHTVVSRETKPRGFALLTVGSGTAGSKSNIIPDHSVQLVNLRTYDMDLRQWMIDATERIVKAECESSDPRKLPNFEYYDQHTLTDDDSAVPGKISRAFKYHFGEETVCELGPQTASEDFSHIPAAFGTPYTFWGLGGTDPEEYERARKAGRITQDIPVNHSEFYAPVIEPTLSRGPEALAVAVLAYLSK